MENFTAEDTSRIKIRHYFPVLLFLLLIAVAANLKVKNITVYGNKKYTDTEAVNLVFENEWDRRTLVIVVNNLLGRKKKIPFVSDYEIDLAGLSGCDLIIYEQNPIGAVRYMSNYMYFDSDGLVLESLETPMEGVPVIEGLEFRNIVLGEKLSLSNGSVLQDIVNITQQLELEGIDCELISFDRKNQATLFIDDGDIEVDLGTNENISTKLSVMSDMLVGIRERGLKGTLDLTNYDESSSGQVTSFKIRE